MNKEIINKLIFFIKNNGYALIKVSTNSMSPTINPGEYVKIEALNSEPEIGQIIAYRKFDDHITIHRLINRIQSGGRTLFVTKGDNNKTNDPYIVSMDSIIGTVYKL